MKLSLICEDEEYDGLDDNEEYRKPDLVDYIKLRSGMVYSYWLIGDEETGDYYRSINKGEIPEFNPASEKDIEILLYDNIDQFGGMKSVLKSLNDLYHKYWDRWMDALYVEKDMILAANIKELVNVYEEAVKVLSSGDYKNSILNEPNKFEWSLQRFLNKWGIINF